MVRSIKIVRQLEEVFEPINRMVFSELRGKKEKGLLHIVAVKKGKALKMLKLLWGGAVNYAGFSFFAGVLKPNRHK